MNLVAHLDEIFLKGNNQRYFIDCLIQNIENLFPQTIVKRIEGGLWIENFKDENLKRLALVPGVANFAKAFASDLDLKNIIKDIVDYQWGSYKSFRIKAERSNKLYPLNSIAIEREVGSAVNQHFGYQVDLSNPELTIHIDISKDRSLVYGNLTSGAGGLPVGTTGKVLCLLSGGIDSPVAAYKMMCRGAQIELIHFQNQTQVTQEVSQKIFDLSNVLSQYQGKINLHIVSFAKWQKEIVMKVPADYRMIITRRLMFKIATNFAKKNKLLSLVTGDSLGQVASQTLENLSVVYESSSLLKLTPLIAFNKSEIMRLARQIGTLEISNRPYEDCCSLFVSKHPKTHSQLEDIFKIEESFDFSELEKIEIESFSIKNSKL